MADIIQKIHQTPPGQDVQALDNLVLFRVDKHRFRYGQSYALLRDDDTMILVDAVHGATRAAVDRWRDRYTPTALILTHSDLVSQAFGSMIEVGNWLNAPVIIHSQDKRGSTAQSIEESDDLLQKQQLHYYHVLGHTPGSIMLYAEPEKFLFTGDSAVGANYEKEATDFTHPPMGDNEWRTFTNGWEKVDLDVHCLLPLHGKPNFAVDNLDTIKTSLLKPDNVMKE